MTIVYGNRPPPATGRGRSPSGWSSENAMGSVEERVSNMMNLKSLNSRNLDFCNRRASSREDFVIVKTCRYHRNDFHRGEDPCLSCVKNLGTQNSDVVSVTTTNWSMICRSSVASGQQVSTNENSPADPERKLKANQPKVDLRAIDNMLEQGKKEMREGMTVPVIKPTFNRIDSLSDGAVVGKPPIPPPPDDRTGVFFVRSMSSDARDACYRLILVTRLCALEKDDVTLIEQWTM